MAKSRLICSTNEDQIRPFVTGEVVGVAGVWPCVNRINEDPLNPGYDTQGNKITDEQVQKTPVPREKIDVIIETHGGADCFTLITSGSTVFDSGINVEDNGTKRVVIKINQLNAKLEDAINNYPTKEEDQAIINMICSCNPNVCSEDPLTGTTGLNISINTKKSIVISDAINSINKERQADTVDGIQLESNIDIGAGITQSELDLIIDKIIDNFPNANSGALRNSIENAFDSPDLDGKRGISSNTDNREFYITIPPPPIQGIKIYESINGSNGEPIIRLEIDPKGLGLDGDKKNTTLLGSQVINDLPDELTWGSQTEKLENIFTGIFILQTRVINDYIEGEISRLCGGDKNRLSTEQKARLDALLNCTNSADCEQLKERIKNKIKTVITVGCVDTSGNLVEPPIKSPGIDATFGLRYNGPSIDKLSDVNTATNDLGFWIPNLNNNQYFT